MFELLAIAKGVTGFFGGTTFRMIWGEASAWLTSRQDHKQELDRMELQGRLDAAQHEREMASIKLQHDIGVDVIRVQSEADLEKLDTDIFSKGVDNLFKSSGIKIVDGWKSVIQPALATMAMVMVGLHYNNLGWRLDDKGWELCGAVLGLFIADRQLFRRGK